MKTRVKATKTHTTSVARTGSFFNAAGSPGFFGPVQRTARPGPAVQTKLAVSKPADPLEKEADRTAEHVMRMPAARAQRAVAAGSPVQHAADPSAQVQRFGEGTPTVASDSKGEIVRASTGGETLPGSVRSFMEPRLGADLGDVRVHADESAASLSNHLSARAFTHRNHVFFARGQYQPETESGRHLIAHELTHTVQQGATTRRSATPELQRTPSVPTPAAAPQVQRFGLDDILDYFADKASYIPGFRMLTLVLGFNPITMRSADRTPANFLRALIELVPGGAVITRALDGHGVINKAADWVMQKVAALGDIGASIVEAIKGFISGLEWSDALSPGSVWDRAKRIVTDPIARLISFGTGVVVELLDLVKQAILRPLAALAEGTIGYDLLKAVLGMDPITGDPVPQNADTLIGGFMKLIGQEEVWQNIKKGQAVARAFAWFQGALSGLLGFVRAVPQRIVQTLTSLTFEDVVTVVGAFRKVGSAFAGLAAEFGSWAMNQVIGLLEILVSVVAPRALPYIAKAKATFHTIVRDPVTFIGHLVRAGKLGFQKFASNILTHLQTALIKWITGPLGEAGVYIPKSFSLIEIIKLVLSVLGLTWQNIRAKLVKIIPDPILTGLEKTAGILVTLVSQGPVAAWEQIRAELTELKDQLIGQLIQMIQTEIVKAAVTKLVSMLNPAGAVIQAILAVHNTVMFFVEKIQQIGAVVASFIDSIAAIAAGQVEGAAKRVEQTMANTLTVVLAFFARFAGLGGVPGKIVGIVKKIRAPIDRALDKIVAWLGTMLDKLVSKAKETAKKLLQWWKKKVPISGGGEEHTLTFKGEKHAAKIVVQSAPTDPVAFMEGHAAGVTHVVDKEKGKSITTTKGHVGRITKLQNALAQFDGEGKATASGTQAAEADKKSLELDTEMTGLGGHIGATLEVWKISDEPVKDLVIERGSFTIENKRAIAAEARRHDPKTKDLTKNVDGEEINVRSGIARRHVVSAYDVGQHYMEVLNKAKVSMAKLLLEERGSGPNAKARVAAPITRVTIKEAALARYRKFFGYATNIFLGDSKENSSIQEHLDPHHPEMAGNTTKLNEHVARIKREWALDDSFKETPVK
jgi:Domain of unknown function (DUF4157)